MYWTAWGLTLLATGVLFAVPLLLGRLSRVRLSLMSRLMFTAAALVCVTTAGYLSTIDHARYPSVLLLLPVVPIAVSAAIGRDALRREDSRAQTVNASPELPLRFEPGHAFSAPLLPPEPVSARRDPDISTRNHPTGDAAARARAHNPHTSASELADLACSYPELRVAVAANPATSPEVLKWLARSGDPVIVALIAARGSRPPLRSSLVKKRANGQFTHGSSTAD